MYLPDEFMLMMASGRAGGGGAIEQVMIDLDDLLNMHYVIDDSITLAGDWSVEVDFVTTSANSHLMLFGDTLGTIAVALYLSTVQVYLGGVNHQFAFTPQTPRDGKLHTVKHVLTGTTLEVFLDTVSLGTKTVVPFTGTVPWLIGEYNTGGLPFGGIQSNFRLDNAGTPTTFLLNQLTGNYERSVEAVVGSEEVTNSDLSSGTDDFYSPRGVSSLSIESGNLRSTSDSSATFGFAQQLTGMVSGETYELTIGIDRGDLPAGNISVRFTTSSSLSTGTVHTFAGSDDGTVTILITATGSTMYLGAITATATTGGQYMELLPGLSVRSVSQSVTYTGIIEAVRDTYTLVDAGVNWLSNTERWSVGDSVSSGAEGTFTTILSAGNVLSGINFYRFSYTASGFTFGSQQFRIGSSSSSDITTDGDYVETYQNSSGTLRTRTGGVQPNAGSTLSDISVKRLIGIA